MQILFGQVSVGPCLFTLGWSIEEWCVGVSTIHGRGDLGRYRSWQLHFLPLKIMCTRVWETS